VRQKRYEIDRERTTNSESVWWLMFQEPAGNWVVERYWKNFDPTVGTATASGTERQSIEAFEASPAGKRFNRQLREAVDRASRDAE
jgi:hypothetical protein